MKKLTVIGLGCGAALIATAASCSVFDDAFIGTVDDMVGEGLLTSDQGAQIITAYLEWVKAADAAGWWNTLLVAAGTALSAYFGVNLFPGKGISNKVKAAQ